MAVGLNSKFQVADHDFTKFSLAPSVTMICDVPESILESFYRSVFCGLALMILSTYSSVCKRLLSASVHGAYIGFVLRMLLCL